MNEKFKITATIVLYKESIAILKKTIDSFLETPVSKQLFLIDNSPTDRLKSEFTHPEIVYIFVGKNIGFGAAHNLILDKISSYFHLILNPDVAFSSHVIPSLINELENNFDISFVTPKVIYPNKELQYVCRKYPTYFDLINRKLKISKEQIVNNEYRDQDLQKSFYPEFIHGCFMLFKTDDLKKIKGFDERYFLYLEDADLCRRVDDTGKKKLYYPKVEITHQHKKGSSKNIKLFFYHISSAIKYFLKWGI